MPNSEEFIPTHNSLILHIKGKPVACIIDKSIQNRSKFDSASSDSMLKASLVGFLNKHDDLGLLMGFKLKIQINDDLFEYTVYPDDELIDTVIFNESVFIVNDKLENLFSLKKIVTDQLVKTRSEFNKFKKLIS